MDTGEEQRGATLIHTENESSLVSETGSPQADDENSAVDGEELQMWVDDGGTSSEEDDVVYTGPQDDEVLSISSSSDESLDSDDDEEAGKSTESFRAEDRVDDDPHCIIERVFENQSSLIAKSSLLDVIRQGHPGMSSSLSTCCALVSLFRRKLWLTACDRKKKMFCWPCLLFGEKYLWSCCIAKIEFVSIALAVSKHEVTEGHKRCVTDFEALEQSEKETTTRRELCRLLQTVSSGVSPTMTACDEDLHADSMLIAKLFTNKLQKELPDDFIRKLLVYGRPRPVMRKFLTHYKIRELPYEKVPWLTASEPLCLLFCWPCLLFISLKNWSHGLEGNYSNLETSMKTHENTITHMLSMLKLKNFEFQMKKINELESDKIQVSPGQIDTKARIILKSAIEAVCCLKKKSLNSKISVDDYIRLMGFLGCCNFEAEKSGDTYEHCHSIVSEYLNGILSVIEFLITSEIMKEVSEARFVSLILEDTAPSLNHSFVAVIIRYVDNSGDVHERFVKFIALRYNRRPDKILPHVEALISQFDCETKLVGFTYDGGVIHPDGVPEFNKEMKSLFPLANFFPYREHDLRKTLLQALSHIPKLRLFFHQLCDLSNFFEETPNAISTFLGIVFEKSAGAEVYNKVWDFSSCFAVTLWDYRRDILAFFEKVTNNPHEWSSETVIRSFGFMAFLQNSVNLSLLLATKILLSEIEDLPPLLAGPFEPNIWKETVHNVATKLSSLEKDYCLLTNNVANDTKPVCSEHTFHLMLDIAEQFILNRFESLDSLAHFTLAENPKELDGRNAENAVEWLDNHSSLVDPERLSTQLKFQFANPFFAEKTLPEILKSIHEFDMVETLPELVKFLNLVLSVPLTVATDTSAVQKMRSYVKENSNLNTTDALIWMEQDLLTRLESDAGFVDRVIEHIT